MIYASITDLVTDVARYYDDSDTATYGLTGYRLNTLIHYANRALQDIWQRWGLDFTTAGGTVAMTGGVGGMPDDFAAVEEGLFRDSTGTPYFPIDYQDMLQMRAKGAYAAEKKYAMGDYDATNEVWNVYIPDTNNADTFTVGYKKVCPTMSAGDKLPVPGLYHGALLAGAVFYTQRSKNDARAEDFRLEFERELGRAKALARKPRAYQMPQTIGGQW